MIALDDFAMDDKREPLTNIADIIKVDVRRSALRIVGRWGGDELIMVLDCDLPGARSQIERMKKGVLGDYTLQVGTNTIKINLDAPSASRNGNRAKQLVQITERADTSVYDVKELSRSS